MINILINDRETGYVQQCTRSAPKYDFPRRQGDYKFVYVFVRTVVHIIGLLLVQPITLNNPDMILHDFPRQQGDYKFVYVHVVGLLLVHPITLNNPSMIFQDEKVNISLCTNNVCHTYMYTS